jgi:hypothetical protein
MQRTPHSGTRHPHIPGRHPRLLAKNIF